MYMYVEIPKKRQMRAKSKNMEVCPSSGQCPQPHDGIYELVSQSTRSTRTIVILATTATSNGTNKCSSTSMYRNENHPYNHRTISLRFRPLHCHPAFISDLSSQRCSVPSSADELDETSCCIWLTCSCSAHCCCCIEPTKALLCRTWIISVPLNAVCRPARNGHTTRLINANANANQARLHCQHSSP